MKSPPRSKRVIQHKSLAAALRTLGPDVASDVETDGIKPLECALLCVGVSDGPNTVVIWPWKPAYAKTLSAFFRSRREVVFHNGFGFDHLVLESHGVDFSGVTLEDTLIGHHTYASHLPQRLDWCVSEVCDSGPWKVVHGRRGGEGATEEKGAVHDMSAADLTRYNASDCRLTALVRQRQRGDLVSEAHVYVEDKQMAAVCREMVRSGIGVDHRKRLLLSAQLGNRRIQLKREMRGLLKWKGFNPGSTQDVQKALFEILGSRVRALTPGGAPSTSNGTLEALKGDDTPVGRLCGMLIDYRAVGKTRSTYVGSRDGSTKFDDVIGRDGRARYNWKLGTVSGRLASRLQSCPKYNPKHVEARVREMYVPAPGHTFVYFDVSQAEMRIAAFLSCDKAFMKSCEVDVHSANAKAVFPDIAAKGWLEGEAKSDPDRGKKFRDISKNLGFAISYLAEAETVYANLHSKGFPVAMSLVNIILARLRATYGTYYKFVEANIEEVRRCGYMRTHPDGRIRWFGRFPKPTDIANYPVQSKLAAIMNRRTIDLMPILPTGTNLVAQIHDACIFETPNRHVRTVRRMISDMWAPPVDMPGGAMILPIDQKEGGSWAGLG